MFDKGNVTKMGEPKPLGQPGVPTTLSGTPGVQVKPSTMGVVDDAQNFPYPKSKPFKENVNSPTQQTPTQLPPAVVPQKNAAGTNPATDVVLTPYPKNKPFVSTPDTNGVNSAQNFPYPANKHHE